MDRMEAVAILAGTHRLTKADRHNGIIKGLNLLEIQGDDAAYVHETDRHFHQSGHLRFNHSRHFARATAGPAPWGGACRWRLT